MHLMDLMDLIVAHYLIPEESSRGSQDGCTYSQGEHNGTRRRTFWWIMSHTVDVLALTAQPTPFPPHFCLHDHSHWLDGSPGQTL